jgi:mono/diheme cytochrome c family protein
MSSQSIAVSSSRVVAALVVLVAFVAAGFCAVWVARGGVVKSDSPTTAPATHAASFADAGAASAATADRINAGKTLFQTTCVGCHGVDARGTALIVKNLVGGKFARTSTDDAMVSLIRTGRPADDPVNVARIAMPPRGGKPELSDDNLKDIVLYLRSLK